MPIYTKAYVARKLLFVALALYACWLYIVISKGVWSEDEESVRREGL